MKEERFLLTWESIMVGDGGSFGTLEENEATGTQKVKWREFTTEISANQHLPIWNAYLHACYSAWGLGAEP